MHRRVTVAAIALLATVGAVACGSDDGGSGTDVPRTTEAPDTTGGPPPSGVRGDLPALPDDPDAAFLTIDGGVPAITADGRLFERTPEPQGIRALPLGEPTGALTVSRLTSDGLAEVVAKANELGLLQAPPDYGDPGITDQSLLTVVLTTADGRYEHSVYAPEHDSGDRDADAARDRLDEFVRFVNSLHMQLADEIGAAEPYVPEQWVVDTSPWVESRDVQPWTFDGDPVDGCATFPSDADVDSVSGLYIVTMPGEDTDEAHVVEVSPALPFDC